MLSISDFSNTSSCSSSAAAWSALRFVEVEGVERYAWYSDFDAVKLATGWRGVGTEDGGS